MRKIIVTDIDDTITTSNIPSAWVSPNLCIREYLDKKDRDNYTIYYVTARPKILEGMTIDWLKRNNFPQSDNLFLDISPRKERYEKVINLCKPTRSGKSQKNDCTFIDDNDGSAGFIVDRMVSLQKLGIDVHIYDPKKLCALQRNGVS